MNKYPIKDLRCDITFGKQFRDVSPFGYAVRLFEESMIAYKIPTCTWNFSPIKEKITGIVIDLTRLDVHSVRLKTTNGFYPASSFQRTKNSGLSEIMVLDIVYSLFEKSTQALYQCKMTISHNELDLLKRRIEYTQTPHIEWFYMELTNKCNYSCNWCPQKNMTRGQGLMSYENAKLLIDKIVAYKECNPLFSLTAEIKNPVELHVMGDPLLHPQLFDIVQYGHDCGLDFCLATNGLLLTPKIAQKILESKIRYIVISLSTTDEKSYLQTGSSGSFQKIVSQTKHLIIERYKRHKMIPRIEIQLLNTKHQTHSVFSAVTRPEQVRKSLVFWSDFVREQEHRWNMVLPPHFQEENLGWETTLDERSIVPGNNFELGHNIYLVYKHTCNFGNSIVPEGYRVRTTHKGHCPFRQAHRTLCIYWDGLCSFCSLDFDNALNIGNVFEDDIESVWNSNRMKRIRGLMDNEILSEYLCQQCLGEIERLHEMNR